MKERNAEQHTTQLESYKPRKDGGNFWLGIIIGGLSVLVLILAYQLFSSRQTSTTATNNNQLIAPGGTPPNSTSTQSPTSPSINSTTASDNTTSVSPITEGNSAVTIESASPSGIQPRQFVQNAFGNKAEVELLKVNRIPGQPDAVNVQFRILAVRADKGTYEDHIYLPNTTAHNPNTGETYKPIPGQATTLIPPLKSMYNDKLPSADGYLWLQIPAEVNAVNIEFPNTGKFKNVPISQPSPIVAAKTSSEIQTGEFVKYAFKNKAQVELLKVNRIPGERNVVNIQARIRPLKRDEGTYSDYIAMGNTTARDPNTSETFTAVPKKSTDRTHITSLKEMDTKNLTSLDTYVWLNIPEGVNTIDIYLPNTQAFTNVPIASR